MDSFHRAHPRLRGEHAGGDIEAARPKGSSPPTRGALLIAIIASSGTRLIPAYAGSTITSVVDFTDVGAHPRLRGEHRAHLPYPAVVDGSSPPTRGAQAGARKDGSERGLIPAYAGSTSLIALPLKTLTAHPRLRGEHLCSTCSSPGESGSSPPTRGARPNFLVVVILARLIPAYAGSTLYGHFDS